MTNNMAEKGLVQKRGRVKGTLTRLKAFAQDISADVDIEDIRTRLTKLEELWIEFKDIEDELLLFEEQSSQMEEFEKGFFETKSLLKRALNSRIQNVTVAPIPNPQFQSTSIHNTNQNPNLTDTNDTPNLSQGVNTTSRLPKLVLPCFSGNYSEWPCFKDLFQSSVHNNDNLTGAQKFQYFKGLLKGDAASLVRHLTITDANYHEAWTKLIQRFDKTSCIASSYIKTFFDISSINQVNNKSLRNLYDTCDEVIRGLKALGAEYERRDPWLLYIVSQKLDNETRELWSREISESDCPTFDKFLKFLDKRCNAIEIAGTLSKKHHSNSRSVYTGSMSSHNCPRCGLNHMLYQCAQFKSDPIHSRKELVVQKSLCFKCLGAHHSVKNCQRNIHCNKCSGVHNPLLHQTRDFYNQSSQGSKPSTTSNLNSTGTVNMATINNIPIESSLDNQSTSTTYLNSNPVTSMTSISKPTVMSSLNVLIQNPSLDIQPTYTTLTNTSIISALPTAIVNVRTNNGINIPCRTLLDSGSQLSLITEAFAQKLKLKRHHAKLSINGLSCCASGTTRGRMTVELKSRWDQNKGITAEVFIMNKLTSNIPNEKLESSMLSNFRNLQLADPSFYEPSSIDMILGVDHFFDVLRGEKKCDANGKVVAYNTIFGWIITGAPRNVNDRQISVNVHIQAFDLDRTLQRFWEIEEVEVPKGLYSSEEKLCEEHFVQHLMRENDRFVVSLPFKNEIPNLGSSFQNALKRFLAIERRFIRDAAFKSEYVKFMREYEQLGHMELIPSDELNTDKCFYLPHHAVYKYSPAPKIRVVFDGSCRSSNGVSLNDELMVGPKIQPDLLDIFMRFRTHIVAFTADIEKMYRQILVSNKDQDFQRIIMRENSSEPIKHYRLKTVTYGTASAPFLAIRALQQVAEDNKTLLPRAASVILTDFYVDDLLTGASTVEEAIQLKIEIENVLKSRGFRLSKWSSNSNKFCEIYNIRDQKTKPILCDENTDLQKILGIQWSPRDDTFRYSMPGIPSRATTKRRILSESSKLFDPLGWLSPITIPVKILLQKLWLCKYDWDDTLPDELIEHWEKLRTQMSLLESLRIPRCIFNSNNSSEIQLHGFCDASESAYAAVVYCRSIDMGNQVSVRVIVAKTKVAPLKQISLPRLELCGALLLARLLNRVVNSLKLNKIKLYTWTDSTIVLTWLSEPPKKWKTFIANRTSEILDILPNAQWRHVRSYDNPADLASRGLSPADFLKQSIWWNGPDWLYKNKEFWPSIQTVSMSSNPDLLETRNIKLSHVTQLDADVSYPFEKFSSFSKSIRVIAYCFRFVKHCCRRNEPVKNYQLCLNEIQHATNVCFKIVQETAFKQDIMKIRASVVIHQKSPLAKLNPFLDKENVLRVGGRLQRADCGYNTKHPIILPQDHIISHLLVTELHRIYLHPGPKLLMGLIRQRFWIIGMKRIVKKVSQSCLVCFRQRLKTTSTSQLMADLPAARVIPSRPFSRVGVDYAGPFNLCYKVTRGVRPMKVYLAIFVCFCTKAVHLESVTSLSSDAFVACLRRFIGRRGIPCTIFSDNGTNFVGANKQLYKLILSNYDTPKLSDFLLDNKIEWKFNPPSAPHFGGLWESAVKSAKWHIQRVVRDTILSFEEFSTLLVQIEAILNSRPYGSVSDDPDDINALTPSHFLIGQPLTMLPESDMTDIKYSRLGRWQQIQSMIQGFWKRWSIEYLTSLQERPKWKTKKPCLKKDDLVVIRQENLPPTKWILGRIIETHAGMDNLVRVATVKTKFGVYRRPIVKLCKLPIT